MRTVKVQTRLEAETKARGKGKAPLKPQLRKARILPVLVASIGEAIQNQELFQVLES